MAFFTSLTHFNMMYVAVGSKRIPLEIGLLHFNGHLLWFVSVVRLINFIAWEFDIDYIGQILENVANYLVDLVVASLKY